jgi:uncharacterized membrane-anchored protein YjiN (DUF445 family)
MRAEPGHDPALAGLRGMQRLAALLLVLAGALYVVARLYEPAHPLLGYLRAFCEAAMVGGLADWFAVTALFRHPLGLRLPHTAIIPTNKDRIGDTLGQFVQRNFLSPEVVAAKIAEIDLAGTTARWLADPQRSAPLAAHIAQFLPRILDAMGDEPVRHFLHGNLVAWLRRVDMASLAADVLETLTAQNRHQALVDEIIAQAERFLRESEPEIRARVREKTAWLWQKIGLDEKVADRLIRAAEEALAEVSADPTHAWRQRFTQLVQDYIAALRISSEYQRRAEALKEALVEHPLLTHYLGAVWDEIRARIREDAALPDSRVRAHLQVSLMRLGEGLLADSAVRDAVNASLRQTLIRVVETRRQEVAALIADQVRRWDAGTLTERIERAIGRDLQYIRINGTVIGGLVGVAIHFISQLFPA